MTRRFLWLRRVSLAVIVVLGIAVAAIAWLLATTSGARFAVRQAVEYAPGQLRIVDVGGTFLGGLELSDIGWVDNDIKVDVTRLSIKVGRGVLWNWRRIDVERLHIDGVVVSLPKPEPVPPAPLADIVLGALPDIRSPIAVDLWDLQTTNITIIEGADATPMTIRELSAVGQLSRSTLTLDIALLHLPKAAFSLEGTIGLADQWRQDWTLDWRLDLPTDVTFGSLMVQGDRQSLAIHNRVEQPAVIETRGTITAVLDQAITVDLRTTADRIDLSSKSRPLIADAMIVDVRGKVSDWIVRLDSGLQGDPFLAGHWSAALAGSGVDFSIDEAVFEPLTGGVLTARATVSLSDALAVDGKLQLDDYALQVSEVVDAQSMTGLVEFSVDDDGQSADVSVREIAGQLNGFDLAVRGAASRRGETLSIVDAVATVGENQLQANGSASLSGDLDIQTTLDARDLSQVSTMLAGRAMGNVSLAGNRASPELSAALQVRDLIVAELAVDRASVEAEWSADAADIRVDADTLAIADQRFADIGLDLTGSLQNHTLAASITAPDRATLEVAATGGYADDTWQGELQQLDVSARGTMAAAELAEIQLQSSVDVTVSPNLVTVTPFCLAAEAQLSLCGELEQSTQDIHADLRLQVENWDALTRMAAIPWRAEGALNLDVEMSGRADNPTMSLALIAPALKLTDQRTSDDKGEPQQLAFNTLSARADIDNGAVDGELLVVVNKLGEVRGELSLDDWRNSQSSIDGSVVVDMPDLVAANQITSSIQLTSGTIAGELLLAGSLAQPIVTGSLIGSEISGNVRALGISIDAFRFDASADQSANLSVTANGVAGSGPLALRGDVDLKADNGPVLKATLKADRARVLGLPTASATATADLRMTATPRSYALDGILTIDEADVRLQQLPESAVQASRDARVYEADGSLRQQSGAALLAGSLDLQLRLGDSVDLAGFGLSTQLAGGLEIKQSAGDSPSAYGELLLRDATYEAYGQNLDVSRGRLVFNGPIESPRLVVRAQRVVDETTVGIDVSGTPDALQSELFSSPTLPDAEAFSLLLTGRNLSVASAGEGADLTNAAVALGLKQVFGVTEGVQSALGLDTLTFDGGGRNGRLLAGKSLSPNLYVQYAYGVFDQISSVLLRLKINDRLSLESSSGESQSVDLIYSVGRSQ